MNVNRETSQEPEKPIRGIKQIANYLGIHPATVWRKRRQLKIYGTGKMQFAFPSELTTSIKSL